MSSNEGGGGCRQEQDEAAVSNGSHSLGAPTLSLSQVRRVCRTWKCQKFTSGCIDVILAVSFTFVGRGAVQVWPRKPSSRRSYLSRVPRFSGKAPLSGLLRTAFLPTVSGKRPRQGKRVSILQESGANFHARQVLRTERDQLSTSEMQWEKEWVPVGGATGGATTSSNRVSVFQGRLSL